MSAINPASFASTATAFQPPSGLGPGAFASESGSGLDRRQFRVTPNSATISASQGGYRALGRVWEPSQESANLNQLPLSHSFAQHYPSSDFDGRHLDQYPVEYPHSSQHLLGVQPRYNSGVYDLSHVHHPLYTTAIGTRDDIVRASDNINTDWNQSFQGLSLGP